MITALGTSLAPYRAFLRPNLISPVEQGYGNEALRVATDVASLSLETRLDLSQKAQVVPPAPPPETRRKSATERPTPRKAQVQTHDFTGRQCSGSLHGPLLMEELEMPDSSARPSGFRSVDFVFEDSQDFASLRSASLALGAIHPEVLQAPSVGEPLAVIPAADSTFAYFGVKNGMAHLVQQWEGPVQAHRSPGETQVRLPDGRSARLSWQQSEQTQLSLYLPAESLDQLVGWGRGLLGEG